MVIFLSFMLCFIIFMFGACIGSFFNVVLLRSPKKESFLASRSYCPLCGKTLRWFELIPVFSFVFQGARCRECRARIHPRYILMELLCGVSCVWAYLTLGFNCEGVLALVLFPVLIALSAEDIEKTEIPYWCTITIAVLGVIATIISVFSPLRVTWYEHLIGAFIISVPFAVFCFLGAMGGGDVQLTAAAGLLLGWAIVPGVLIAMLVGGIFGAVIKLTKKRATICFGPFLSVGIALGYIYGYDVIAWYSKLIN